MRACMHAGPVHSSAVLTTFVECEQKVWESSRQSIHASIVLSYTERPKMNPASADTMTDDHIGLSGLEDRNTEAVAGRSDSNQG